MKPNVQNIMTGEQYHIPKPEEFVKANKKSFQLIAQKETVLPDDVIQKEEEVKELKSKSKK